MGPLWPRDSTKCNPVLALEVLLDVMNCLVGALYPPLFDDSIQIPFIYEYILISFYSIRFSYVSFFKMALRVSCPFLQSLLYSSHIPPYLILYSSFPFLSPQHYVLFSPPWKILSPTAPPSPVPCQIPKFHPHVFNYPKLLIFLYFRESLPNLFVHSYLF